MATDTCTVVGGATPACCCSGVGRLAVELIVVTGKVVDVTGLRTDVEVIESSIVRPAVFEHIFARHWDQIFRFIERRLGFDSAEELSSEVFRIAFERRSSFSVTRNASCLPWLYGIASNLVLKHRRQFTRHLRAISRLEPTVSSEFPDIATEVVDRLDATNKWPTLSEALTRLDETSVLMLLMIAWEDASYAEVAAGFEVPVGTVRSRIHRIRAELKVAAQSPQVVQHDVEKLEDRT